MLLGKIHCFLCACSACLLLVLQVELDLSREELLPSMVNSNVNISPGREKAANYTGKVRATF